jgi:hypothetical protein
MYRCRPCAILVIGVVVAGSFLLSACSSVPITGTQQLSLVSSEEMLSMGTQQYNEFLKTNKVVPSGDDRTTMVGHREVNDEDERDLYTQHGVTGTPALFLFKKQVLVDRQFGEIT